jgi:plastocyanin
MRAVQAGILSMLVASWSNAVPAYAETIRINIENLEFSPSEAKATVGDTVEWINHDILAHTATAPGAWDIVIAANSSERLILNQAGSVYYFCRFHPNMKGRIVIQ